MYSLNKSTVFFLGAGFSKEAGAPLQGTILEKVLNYNGPNYGNPVEEYLTNVRTFLEDAFNLHTNQAIRNSFCLEDFYTPIDKCINDNLSFRGYSVDHIRKVRNQLSTLVSMVIDNEIENSGEDDGYLDTFASYIVHNSRRSREYKPAVISTNWDILLDRRIYRRINGSDAVDLGTHVTGFGERQDDQMVPAMVALARGNHTVKLFNIHGSLNWLKCPSCSRLFVKPNLKIGIMDHSLNLTCRFCRDKYRLPANISDGFKLEPQIIYPTFLKELNNQHFISIWEATARAISKAKQIVFIGYSFQQADFEIRQLLARYLPDDCKVICVSHSERPDVGSPEYSNSTVSRYEAFFGGREFEYYAGGARNFVTNHLGELE